jgi:hypothetical protein
VTDIRALERDDLPAAATLYDAGFRDGRRPADPAIAGLLERLLFDNPWADPEIPSLLARDGRGRAVGLIGASARRLVLDGQPVRLAVESHLVVDPAAQDPLAAPRLIRHLLDGPQDATITDTAVDSVRHMWMRLGGGMRHLECFEWIRVFHPWATAAAVAERRRGRRLGGARAVAALLEAPTAAAARRYLRAAPPEADAQPLTPETLVRHLPALSRRLALWPDYDEPYAAWLLRESVGAYRDGAVVGNLVLDGERALGWYVYVLRPGAMSEVIGVAAGARDIDAVLDHLLAHAGAHGAAAVRGRLEPALVEPVARRRCLLRFAGRALIHSRNDRLAQVVATGPALLTRLEGEWWFEAASGWDGHSSRAPSQRR